MRGQNEIKKIFKFRIINGKVYLQDKDGKNKMGGDR
jgi:hypothetical protein